MNCIYAERSIQRTNQWERDIILNTGKCKTTIGDNWSMTENVFPSWLVFMQLVHLVEGIGLNWFLVGCIQKNEKIFDKKVFIRFN